MDEWNGTGVSPVALAVPLVTGGSTHEGLKSLMTSALGGHVTPEEIECAVDLAVQDFKQTCTGRNFDVDQLESQSYVFNEQLALVEALVRLAGLRVVPKILELYEVLEVERMDVAPLIAQEYGGPELDSDHKWDWTVNFRSIPDALLRERSTGDLYILSWKTTAEFDQRKDQDARVDMQGLSECWAAEERLKRNWEIYRKQASGEFIGGPYENKTGEWLQSLDSPPTIRGVQMVYLIKGQRRKRSKEDMISGGLTADQIAAGGAQYKTASPLIYGYINDPSGTSPKFAFSSDWHCSRPHSMRKSQWYPSGECPGDGRLHKRGDEWKSFPAWELVGIKTWMGWLADGTVSPEAGDPLDQSWAMPVPHYRTRESVESWHRQTVSAEKQIASALLVVREYESAIRDARKDEDNFMLAEAEDGLMRTLDEYFPQSTEKCSDWFHRRCPAWEICHGPGHIASDPVGSGLFQIKVPYAPEIVVAESETF